MAKEIKAYIKLQITWGQATPAPPVGPALGQHGVPIAQFTQQFNEQTKDRMGKRLPVVITVYEDKTFSFIVKQPPMTNLIKDKIGLASGSKLPHKEKVGHLTFDQCIEVAKEKMSDLNAIDMAWAMKLVDGSARSIGITSDIHEMSIADLRTKLAK